MRKIYPPFNKFVGFLIYGLLSIAVITLAQSIPSDPLTNNCKPKLTSPLKKQVAIGYVQLNNAMEIPWNSYDYINVIAYPKTDGWNNIHPPPQEQLNALNDLKAKKPPTANTKVLLSIRNYDIIGWPESDKDYGKIVTETISTIKTFDLDGVDIEYPGMRGFLCPKGPDNGAPLVWNKGRDVGFVKFLGTLRAQMDQKKIIMLTVGRNVIDAGLSNYIKYLNIETYHFSLYENLRELQDINNNNNNVWSFPNAPYDEFTSVHDAWAKAQIGVEIIMGVDIGNTFQVVFNNPNTPPTLEVNFFPQNLDEFFRQDPDLANIQSIQPINNLCPGDIQLNDRLHLYSFPWKDLIKISKCKNPIPKWNYNVDDSSSTPWLYKESENFPGGPAVPGGPGAPVAYYYISFEDFDSLNKKLSYVTNTIGGVSISDVSYDVVGDDSLIGFIQAIRSATPSQSPNGPSSPNSPNSPNESPPKGKEGETKDGINESDDKNLKSTKIGAIVGGVFGSLVLVILGVCGFYFYRYRKLPKSSSSIRSFLKFNKGFPNSRNHVISRNPEMTSEPTLAPPTTVIPVASGYVTAMFDFTGKEENDLSFKKGDKIEVLERGDGPNDWWVGRVNGAVGEFPGNYVKET